ncbi:MAG: restriction endonuclease subunit S, partial [Candidatus Falkowbacteria bacterium]|nr:restriction endonuclease subunit S [Candidatus Falkowbacteria bacterium]
SGAYSGFVNYFSEPIFASDSNTIKSKDENQISTKLIFEFLKSIQSEIYSLQRGQAQPHVYGDDLAKIKIPIPPKDIQEKIMREIEEIERKEEEGKKRVEELENETINLFENRKQETTSYRLSDSDIFEISIGKRVIKKDLLEKGEIPVYSANVFEPFGYVNKLLIEDFSIPSILWGIDGDWMVNYMPENKMFYPTDHCGVLRIKDKQVSERYLAYFLQKEGIKLEFSRNKRASIDRIQGLKISLPPLPEQQKIIAEIEKIEKEIETLQAEIDNAKKQKEKVLRKYL